MGGDEALVELASTAIESEIRAYFPYTALYRRLCKGGLERAVDYLYREFAPTLAGATDDSTPAILNSMTAAAASSAGPALPRRKRTRTSVVEGLRKDLEAFTVATLKFADAPLRCTAPPDKQCAGRENSATTLPSTTLGASGMPYMVTCRRCTTRVTSTYPCWVLEGYVVLWAESVLEVECVAGKAAVAALSFVSPVLAAHTHGSSSETGPVQLQRHSNAVDAGNCHAANALCPPLRPSLCSSLPPMGGLRPPSHRLSSAFECPLERSAEEAAASPASSVATAKSKAARSHKRQDRISSKDTRPCASTVSATPTTEKVTLHSLHIVSSDAASNPRPASFAVQSVLLPGWQTALECYPRHMMHFGLLVYAAWHASPKTWKRVLSDGGAAGSRHGAVLPSCSSRSAAAVHCMSRKRAASETSEAAAASHSLSCAPEEGREACVVSLAELLPYTAHDAVLVLGLGGNVLGQCLDALLPAVVPLHIVEVEPAVLQACYEHGQFPEIAAVDGWGSGLDAVPSCEALKPATAPRRRKALSLRSAEMADTAAAAAVTACPAAPLGSPASMQRVADLIHRRSATPVAFRATRQQATGVLERLGAPLPAVPTRTAKRTKCTPGWRGASATETGTPLQSQQGRSEYVCFLQDAYAYLRAGTFSSASSVVPRSAIAQHQAPCSARGAAHPVAPSLPQQADRTKSAAHARTSPSTREAVSAGAAEAAPPPVQYSMIFLDCYDPGGERMMHEGTLVELCARRLRPGGVLLVNAHVVPTVANLRCDFLSYDFATVQALRVAGYTQTVVACVARDAAVNAAPAAATRAFNAAVCAPFLTEKRGRFTVRQMRLLAAALNRALHRYNRSTPGVTGGHDGARKDEATPAAATGKTASSSSHSSASLPSHSVKPAFRFDAAWLKSCRRVAASPTNPKSRSRASAASTTPSQACAIDVDLQVWEHHF
ncbi:hypothetical protein GH5_04054 [Leishmania sp. Ghana 2012 LV757]|uniref:hypothetical protein n=1 Tax=Leishmania sp. Ghana 2012 LV757 TaxID=2803181 RepID=UPI001B695F37|nr:hypothetical protein GH5_04054 [Leishmania sp. Ghana 2012 LV757]